MVDRCGFYGRWGVWGDPEGEEVGYNPHKKGQKSYRPLMAFVGEGNVKTFMKTGGKIGISAEERIKSIRKAFIARHKTSEVF